MDGIFSAEQVAAALGLRPVTVRSLAKRHGIGQKYLDRWYFTPADLEQFRQIDHTGGQPAHRSRARKSG